jgi:hypothetical protein
MVLIRLAFKRKLILEEIELLLAQKVLPTHQMYVLFFKIKNEIGIDFAERW